MKRFLITGSTGFIGNRCIDLLNTMDCDIRLLSRSEFGHYETIICDFEKDKIPEYALESVDTVLHIAGFAHDMQDPIMSEVLYRKINVDTTVNLAKLAVKKNVKRFLFVSSVKAGGENTYGQCMSEVNQTDPISIYGKTKREAELELLKIGKASSMHICIVRPSLVYGPNAKGNLQLMLSAVKKGWFPPLPEIGNRRSMIHVDDLVRAILLVAEDDRTNGQVYIATDGNYYSSREIYDIMSGIVGKGIHNWSVPKFIFDILALISPRIQYKINKLLGDECYSSEKLESLGFKAQRTLREMNEAFFSL